MNYRFKTTTGEKATLLFSAFLLLAFCTAFFGWGWNVVKLIALLDGGITAMFVARIVGIFVVPLGVILGFF